MRVCGCEAVEYELGGALVFLSALQHETVQAMEGDVKLAVFFGDWVDERSRDFLTIRLTS